MGRGGGEGMASLGSPIQRAPRKRRGGAAAGERCTGSPATGMAATVLAQAKPGDAAAAHGGQGKGSMAGVFLCLVARLPSVLCPAASSVCVLLGTGPVWLAACVLGISAHGRTSVGQAGEGSTLGSR